MLDSDPFWKIALMWVIVLAVVSVAAAVLCVLVTTVRRRSLVGGTVSVWGSITGLFRDLANLRLRRVWAIARLAVKEAVHNKVLLVFLFFIVILLFAGWYLQAKENLVRVYVSFITKVTSFFVILVAIFMSAISLPTDMIHKTIHTVVTKPIRRLEIILGRVLGFAAISTFVLAVMAGVSLYWLHRAVARHDRWVETQIQQARSDPERTRLGSKRQAQYLQARVPVYGRLKFGAGEGDNIIWKSKGKNVGFEWDYWSFVEGPPSKDVAVWEFTDIPLASFGDATELALTTTFTVFRSTKGVLGQGVAAKLTFINPETNQSNASNPTVFFVDEYRRKHLKVPRRFVSAKGGLRVEARCLDPTQYVGMNQRDLYLVAGKKSFDVAFLKSMVGTWLQVMILIVVAVTASTFLKGPVAILTSLAVYFSGSISDYLGRLASGQLTGGGPAEAAIRIYGHNNLLTDMPDTAGMRVARSLDFVYEHIMQGLLYVIPKLDRFDATALVANGFDVPVWFVWRGILLGLGYVVPCLVFAYFCLKHREVADIQ